MRFVSVGLIRIAVSFLILSVSSLSSAMAAGPYKPFILASKSQADFNEVIVSTKKSLIAADFEIAGDFSPYENAHVIAVTNSRLKEVAGSSKRAGYIAVQRVSVTKVNDEVQVAYTNPEYMSYAYRLKDDLVDVRDALANAIGKLEDFGSEGLTKKKLLDYNYAWGMEEFNEPDRLTEYNSYKKAVEAVEKGLKENKLGAYKVYRVDVPGKQVTLFGVGLKSPNMFNKYQDDGYIMSVIDFQDLRGTAHLPYEILVEGKKIESLNARFRIAINFPDLGMTGEHSFMKIMGAPAGIKKAFLKISGGEEEDF